MVLSKLEAVMKGVNHTPESMAEKSKLVTNLTIRRAIKGRGVDLPKVREIARILRVKVGDLV